MSTESTAELGEPGVTQGIGRLAGRTKKNARTRRALFPAQRAAQAIRAYAGSVRNSTYSPVVISSKSFAASSYLPAFHASSPR